MAGSSRPAPQATATVKPAAGADEYQRESAKGYGILAIFGGTFLCFVGMVFLMSRGPDITLDGEHLVVRSGAYGTDVPMREIQGVQLVRQLSGLGLKMNAHQFGSTYAGRFRMKPYGEALLFLNATKPPFILVRSSAGVLLFNARDSMATKALFDSLSVARAER